MYSMAPTSSPRVGWAATSTLGSWRAARGPAPPAAGCRPRATTTVRRGRRTGCRIVDQLRGCGAQRGGRASRRERQRSRIGEEPGSRPRSCRARTRSRAGPRGSRRPGAGPSRRPARWRRAPVHLDPATVERAQAGQQVARARWPLPSTPATPTISPGRHVEVKPSSSSDRPSRGVARRTSRRASTGATLPVAPSTAGPVERPSTSEARPEGRRLAAQRHLPPTMARARPAAVASSRRARARPPRRRA